MSSQAYIGLGVAALVVSTVLFITIVAIIILKNNKKGE